MNGIFASLMAIAAFAASAPSTAPDPPSGSLDPPPGPQEYIATFAPHSWVFGKLLWQGREPCTEEFCEAAYNAKPLFLLVQKEAACCGGMGYSLTVVGRVSGCASVSYYLAWSKDFDKLNRAERLAFLARHVAGVASRVSSSCGKPLDAHIPTDELVRLWK